MLETRWVLCERRTVREELRHKLVPVEYRVGAKQVHFIRCDERPDVYVRNDCAEVNAAVPLELEELEDPCLG